MLDKAHMALQVAARWLVGGQPLDPRVVAVLREVARTGSLNQAVATLRMSYRNAWGLLGRTERALRRPLLVLRRGQGARLTAFGESLLQADSAAAEILARGLAAELKALNQESAPGASQARARPLVVHASHDFALAALRDLLSTDPSAPGMELHFRGSLDSLADLAHGLCEVAGFHVPADPADDRAYDPYRPLLRARSLRLVHFVTRRQGLMVARGNPKGIRGLADLGDGRVRFINRQQGSGTRAYFEYLLSVQRLRPEQIAGYQSEEFTHAAIAATVASGMADAGFGIEAAARQQELDFIPLGTERYLLAARRGTVTGAAVQAILATLGSPEFRGICRRLSGYDPAGAGEIVETRDVLAASGAVDRAARRVRDRKK
jgi:molybdate transport repressor ModE-like protein